MTKKAEQKSTLKEILKDQSGAMGVKQIAMIVAAIIVIGAAATYLSNSTTIGGMISEVWNFLFGEIKKMIGA